MIRILLADDHDVVRHGLRGLLETHPEWSICAEAASGPEAVALARDLKPDVAVVDLAMPELHGLEATRQIRKVSPQTEVLVFTMHETEQLVHDVLAAGARGYVLKSDAVRHLVDAVEALMEHRPYFSSTVNERIIAGYLRAKSADGAASPTPDLTPRERQIVKLLAEGRSNKDIAVALSISVKTVETHRAAVMRKLDIHSLAALVHYAIRSGIVDAGDR